MFDGMPNTTSMFNKTFSIQSEGVFSTYFLFGPYKTVEPEESEKEGDDGLSGFIDDVFGDDRND